MSPADESRCDSGQTELPGRTRGRSPLASVMNTMTYEFDRLEQTVGMIKRHPYYPGKELVLDECLEDIDDRYRQGRLTAEQRGRLRDILQDSTRN